jgi:hypothetical protein
VTHPRAEIRAALRAGFAVAPGLAGVAILTGWVFPKDSEDLPALTVVTPRERVDASTGSSVDRLVEIVVVLKARGGDEIEDRLDDLSEVIEAEVIAALAGLEPEPVLYGLSTVDMQVEAEANKRVGTLEMRFEAMRFADEGAQQL